MGVLTNTKLDGYVRDFPSDLASRRVLSFLGFPVREPTTVYEDNEAAQALACNEIMTKRSIKVYRCSLGLYYKVNSHVHDYHVGVGFRQSIFHASTI